jgi:hypothetical protein
MVLRYQLAVAIQCKAGTKKNVAACWFLLTGQQHRRHTLKKPDEEIFDGCFVNRCSEQRMLFKRVDQILDAAVAAVYGVSDEVFRDVIVPTVRLHGAK